VSAGQVWRPVTAGGSLGAPLVTVVLCAAVVPLVRAGRSGSAAAPGWVALGTTVVVAAVLLVRADIHGAALAAGLLIARPASGGTVAVPDPSVLP